MYDTLIASISAALQEHGIPYMLILLYGSPRLTRDIDITLGIGVNGLPKIISTVTELGLTVIPGNWEEFVRNTYGIACERSKDRHTGRPDFLGYPL